MHRPDDARPPGSVVARHTRTLSTALAADWLARADTALQRAASAPPADAGYVPTASSLRLSSFAELPWAELREALAHTDAIAAARAALGGPLAVCLSQSWLRRQYPPALAPADHAPHQWHQDGALGWHFDLQAPGRAPPAHALLALQTIWIALCECGTDAPALQWVVAALPGLLPLNALTDATVQAAVQAAVGAEALGPLCALPLAAGDALRFDGALLHRTQPATVMARIRTSIELRLFDARALPERLAGETWVILDDG